MDPVAKNIRERLDAFAQGQEQSVTTMTVAGFQFTPPKSLSKFFDLPAGQTIANMLGISSHHFDSPLKNQCAQRAIDLENQHGLTGIAGRYNLPEGVTAHDLQSFSIVTLLHDYSSGRISKDQALGKLNEVAEALMGRNPSLQQLSYDRDSVRENFDVIMGVASAFNVADIQQFLGWTRGVSGAIPDRQPSPLEKSVAAKLGMDQLPWHAAPSTLQALDRQLSPELKMAPQAAPTPGTAKTAAAPSPSSRR